jgi:TolA-binding protein
MKVNYLIALFTAITIISCKSEKQKLTEQIQMNEQKLFNDSTRMLNVNVAADELAAYQKYATTFPDDSASPSYLFKAADLAHGLRKNHDAVNLYKTFISKYPDHAKAAPSLFLQGFIYDTEINQKDSAKVIYKEFLTKYPTHPLAASAKASLDQLESGMSDEELVKMFEAKLDTTPSKSPPKGETSTARKH